MRELAGNLAGDGAAWLSRAVHTEVALLHCLEAVQHLPVPNRFRTECVCQLFDRLAAGLGRHEPLLRELQGELFASIYEGFKPVAGGCVENAALAVRAEAAEKLAAEKAEAAENLQARLEELTKAASDAAAARRQQLALAA